MGPSGTGKELIARSIHQQSRRLAGPWVAVDCTSIPAGLFASQLFGHVKGAFSGASCASWAAFAQPTAEPSFSTKSASWARTCRPNCCVIQDRAVTPVGDHRSQPVDVRIIAATNRDLRGDVAAGRFRLDLYYRLNVVKLTTIPLSQRPEDIEPLCHGFLERWSIENGLPPRRVRPQLQTLMDYEWPGNVRQLQNILERATVFTDSRDIAPEHLLEALDSDREPVIAGALGTSTSSPTPSRPAICAPWSAECCGSQPGTWPTLAECESWLLRATLDKTSQNQRAAARLLGVDWGDCCLARCRNTASGDPSRPQRLIFLLPFW